MKLRLLFLALFVCSCTWADGPHVALHATGGAYTVTLFTAPDPLAAGPVSFELLVQNAGDDSPVALPTARVRLAIAGQPPTVVVFTPSTNGGTVLNAHVSIPKPGIYALQLEAAERQFTGELPVAENHGRRNTVLWAVLTPLLAILLFLANQYGKQRIKELQ